jgi:hypothetical protein
LRLSSNVHEPCLAKDPQMLRDRRLAQLELRDQLPHGPLTISKQVEDTPSVGFREDVENGHRSRA